MTSKNAQVIKLAALLNIRTIIYITKHKKGLEDGSKNTFI